MTIRMRARSSRQRPGKTDVPGAGRGRRRPPARSSRLLTLVVGLLALSLAAALACGCGGSSDGAEPAGPSASSPMASTPTASPLPAVAGGHPADAEVRAYWAAVADDDSDRLARLVTPDHLQRLLTSARTVKRATVKRIIPAVDEPPTDATAQVPVDVYIEPVDELTPWGAPAVHRVWMTLLGFEDGTWLVADVGTSP